MSDYYRHDLGADQGVSRLLFGFPASWQIHQPVVLLNILYPMFVENIEFWERRQTENWDCSAWLPCLAQQKELNDDHPQRHKMASRDESLATSEGTSDERDELVLV